MDRGDSTAPRPDEVRPFFQRTRLKIYPYDYCMKAKNLLLLTVVLAFFLTSTSASAAIPRKSAPTMKNWLVGQGSFHGGNSGDGFSLLELKLQKFNKSNSERLVFLVGNPIMKPMKGQPGYFNVELRKDRLLIDFAQTINSRFEAQALKKIVSQSKMIKGSKMFFEPHAQTMSIELILAKPLSARVTPIKGTGKKTAQVVIDLVPKR